jgi:chemotaxis response regulator CheB
MKPRRVLIVDQSDEMRQLLKSILATRGWEILEARASRQGLDIAHDCHPDVIVLDVETVQDASARPSRQDVPAWQAEEAPVVFLGKLPHVDSRRQHRCLAKPYHYAPLLRTIEELLELSRDP